MTSEITLKTFNIIIPGRINFTFMLQRQWPPTVFRKCDLSGEDKLTNKIALTDKLSSDVSGEDILTNKIALTDKLRNEHFHR